MDVFWHAVSIDCVSLHVSTETALVRPKLKDVKTRPRCRLTCLALSLSTCTQPRSPRPPTVLVCSSLLPAWPLLGVPVYQTVGVCVICYDLVKLRPILVFPGMRKKYTPKPTDECPCGTAISLRARHQVGCLFAVSLTCQHIVDWFSACSRTGQPLVDGRSSCVEGATRDRRTVWPPH